MVKQAEKKGRPIALAVPAKMDIRTVAQLANTSIATVSRTVNRVSTVNPKLAKRVWAAIAQLDYFPNSQARALVSGRSRLLGLIVSDITNPFFPELIQGFEEIAVEHGYEILIGSTNDDSRRVSLCIRRMLERRAEGVAVLTFGVERPLLEQLSDRKVPLVFVDVGQERPGISLLRVDYRHGVRQGVQHLAVLGHRKIAFISGPRDLHSAQSRQTAFIGALEECGIKSNPLWMVEGDHTMEGGIKAMHRLLQLSQPPTAVMCSNDMTAIGVLHQVYRAGLGITRRFVGHRLRRHPHCTGDHSAAYDYPNVMFRVGARGSHRIARACGRRRGAEAQLQDRHAPCCPRIHRLPQRRDARSAQTREKHQTNAGGYPLQNLYCVRADYAAVTSILMLQA